VYWLGPTRYLRWVAVAVVLGVGLYTEFRPQHTTDHPFAGADIEQGRPISPIEWRPVPVGLLPPPHLDGAVAAVAIGAGEPLLPSQLARPTTVPAGWWSIPVAMLFTAPPGTVVQLVDGRTGSSVDGVVITEPPDDPFAIEPTALIAVPPEQAASFAIAAASGEVTVLIAGG
jgi:hypothetical protein